MSVIQRVKEIIEFKNITQPKLGKASGVHKNTVQKMLANDTEPSIKVIRGLKELVPNVSLDWLILGKGKMFESDSVGEREKKRLELEKHAEEIDKIWSEIDKIKFQQGKK